MGYQSHHEAHAAGTEVLNRLHGKGWQLQVHENGGWHWGITNGYLQLHGHEFRGKASFFCLVSQEYGQTGGKEFWSDKSDKSYFDPNEAIAAQLTRMKKLHTLHRQIIQSIENTFSGKKAKPPHLRPVMGGPANERFFKGLKTGDLFTYAAPMDYRTVASLASRYGVEIAYCTPMTPGYREYGDCTVQVTRGHKE